jgi:mRNA-degrading endonuclease RelE of RelBE toxin-antitoxin system
LPKLELKTPAKEQLAALPRHIQEELDPALLRLQANPTEEGIRLGPSLAGLWRMRVSGYRILYRCGKAAVSSSSSRSADEIRERIPAGAEENEAFGH